MPLSRLRKNGREVADGQAPPEQNSDTLRPQVPLRQGNNRQYAPLTPLQTPLQTPR
ncbi:hypothetical protein CBM2589_B120242 [Cupriavidus taiwanensis]|uniref:Uncharacterized protein n=1 Tax=Cupriavidus taiwanensis TaxID=164546 RepID=A0A375BGU1_9BURK|nr:hypothetical protein CBM2589_B120242 [Cupriavidus taiwanensis]